MKIIGLILVVIPLVLFLWSAGGVLEWILPAVPWKAYSNPDFPKWLLAVHWTSVLFASVVYIYGYFSRWGYTPVLMAVAYGAMALVCLIETFGYMTRNTRFLAMGLEYAAYIIILLILFTPRFSSQHFDAVPGSGVAITSRRAP